MRIVNAAPGSVLVLALLSAFAAAAFAVLTLQINTSSKDMLSEDLPYRQYGIALEAAFPDLDAELVAIIEADDPARAQIAAKALVSALQAGSEVFLAFYYPPSDEFFVRNGILYLPVEELDALLLGLADATPLLIALRENPPLAGIAHLLSQASDGAAPASELEGLKHLLAEILSTAETLEAGHRRPIAWASLMSEGAADDARDGRIQVIALRPKLDFTTLQPARIAARAVRDAFAALPEEQRIATTLYLTGSALMFQEELESLEANMSWIGLIAFVAVACLLLLGLGSARAALALVVTLAVGLAWTAGFAALAVGTLNLISVAFAVLFIGLGVDFGIHFQVQLMGEQRSTLADALFAASERCRGVLGLCALSSAIGFYAFLPTNYRGLSELGLISGSAMFIALAATFSVLPAALAVLRWSPGGQDRGYGSSFAGAVLAAESAGKRNYRPILLVAVLVGALSVACLPLARFDDDPMSLRDPDTPAVKALNRFAGQGGLEPYAAEVLLPDLQAARDLAARLTPLPNVRQARTLDDLVPDDQTEKLELMADLELFLPPALFSSRGYAPSDDGARRASLRALLQQLERPDNPFPQLAARLSAVLAPFEEGEPRRLLMLERMILGDLDAQVSSLQASLGAERITEDNLPAALKSLWLTPDGRARVEVLPAADLTDQAARQAFIEAVQGIAPEAGGSSVGIVEGGRAVIAAFTEALLYAVGAIVLLLWARLRSLTDVLFVLTPLGLAGVVTVAVASLLDWPFNFANVIVLPLLFGLGVDSGIHMVSRARGRGGRPEEGRTLQAIVLSSMTTVASFGALSFSEHPGTASMGRLLTLAILLGLIASLFVLPALLTLRARSRPQ
jgi:hopanoid biosynthesis associated RND transporter like protein HpnN